MLEVVMLWSEGCEACQRTKPVIHKIISKYPSIDFHFHKVVNSRYNHFLLNNMGIPIDEDVTLSEEDKEEIKSEGIYEVSALPTFFLRDTRKPFLILETIVGGVNKPPTKKERWEFERMFCAMLDKYDDMINHRSIIKFHYGEFEVRQDPFPDI